VVESVRAAHRPEQHAGLRTRFDELAGVYLVAAFDRLGRRPAPGDHFRAAELADRLGVVPSRRRLWTRLLALAAEDGWLADDGDWCRVVLDPPAGDAEELHREIVAEFPAFEADLRLARRCATALPEVLRGETDPLHLLFDGEGAELTARLYEDSPVARFYNEALTKSVEALVAKLPADRPLRVLEIGAGTGGTTAHVLPRLPAGRTEYVFTDVSPMFLAGAREKFRDYPFVQFHTLDLERPPAEQGFADGQFDLILAANVVHATADLRRSVRHARGLLAPAGLLVLLEGTGPRRLLDLIFGLTDGWWAFADDGLRPDYPLISGKRWARLLTDEGFGDVACLPAPDDRMTDPDQVVVLARGPADLTAGAGRPMAGTTFVLHGDGGELAECLARRLRAAGAVVTTDATGHDDVRTVTFGDAAATADGWVVTRGAAPFGKAANSAAWADALRAPASWTSTRISHPSGRPPCWPPPCATPTTCRPPTAATSATSRNRC
jgi:SAM-dependent methyltransferase